MDLHDVRTASRKGKFHPIKGEKSCCGFYAQSKVLPKSFRISTKEYNVSCVVEINIWEKYLNMKTYELALGKKSISNLKS
jgi:hypothetical protein